MKTSLLLTLAGWAVALAAIAQPQINRSVIASGGGASAGQGYSLHGTLGQAVLGRRTNASINLESGFWSGIRPPPGPPFTGPLVIFELTNRWRYHQDLNLDGTGWQLWNYDDANWAQGNGLLAFENAVALQPLIHTALIDPRVPASGLPPPRTYYFRTHFSLESIQNLSLVFSNRIDDGAVAYLNGVEIWRIGMPTGAVSYVTLADRSVTDAVSNDVVTVPGWPNARVGENVLAVEVHQNSSSSSDAVWGCAIAGVVGAPPVITEPPLSLAVQPGNNAVFSVTATGAVPLSYRWQRNGVELPEGTNQTYLVSAAQLADAGDYRVQVSNPFGSVVSLPATLTVLVPPLVTAQPQSQSHCAGANVTFTVAAIGTPPLRYQWRVNGRDIPDAVGATFALENVQLGDMGNYSVRVSGPTGEAISTDAALTVLTPITVQSASNVVAIDGLPVSLATFAQGSGPFVYQWARDAALLPGETNAWLVLNAVRTNEAGVYSAVVQGPCGIGTSYTRLTVATPPEIIDQPSHVLVRQGAPFTVHVRARGTPPLKYQWRLNGTPLLRATNDSFTLMNAQPSDAGTLTVNVRNEAGRVVSARAEVTVVTDAQLSIARLETNALISWQGTNWLLQSAAQVTGAWSDVGVGTTSDGWSFSWVTPMTATQQFYRLCFRRPPFSFAINPSLIPSRPTLAGLSGGPLRPVAMSVDPRGQTSEFVANEVILRPADPAELSAFLTQYGGRILRDGTPFAIPGAPKNRLTSVPFGGWYLIQVDPARSALEDLASNVQRAGGNGALAFSSENGARLAALVLRERHRRISLNPLVSATAVPEHPTGDGGNLDAETWWYLNEDDNLLTPEIDGVSTGVIRAWRYLEYMNVPPRSGSWAPPVIAIVDSGFDLDAITGYPNLNNIDYPNYYTRPEWQMDVVDADGTAGGRSYGPVPWHGQAVFAIAAARPRNGFGTAGTGGPVADWPMLIRSGEDAFTLVDGIRTAWYNGADIINISSIAFCLPRWLCELLPDDLYTSMQREVDFAVVAQNAIVVASAGNDGADISGGDLIPVGLSRVIGVGSVDHSKMNVYNFGDGVDIWAPTGSVPRSDCTPQAEPMYGTLDPVSVGCDANDVGADELAWFAGTSASAPFTSGVLALMRALNPALRSEDALAILQETANPSGDSRVRYGSVDAFRAVNAVRPNQTPIVLIRAPADGATISYKDPTFLASITDPDQGPSLHEVSVGWELDGTPMLCSGGWCEPPALSEGTHTLRITATDPFGLVGTDSATFTVVNRLPVVGISAPANNASFCADQTIVFRGSAFDPEDGALPFPVWSSNLEGALGSGPEIARPLTPGTHQITLTGTDGRGGSANHSIQVLVAPPCGLPSARILSPLDQTEVAPGTAITLLGQGNDPEDGSLTGASLEWRSDRDGFLGRGTSVTVVLSGPPEPCQPDYLTHVVTLTVTDSAGNRVTHQIRIRVGRVC